MLHRHCRRHILFSADTIQPLRSDEEAKIALTIWGSFRRARSVHIFSFPRLLVLL